MEHRRWLSVEIDREYASLSAVRFMEGWDMGAIIAAVDRMRHGEALNLRRISPVEIQMRFLMESPDQTYGHDTTFGNP